MMKKLTVLLAIALMAASATAAVHIIVEAEEGMAAIYYKTDGEHVRAFALDVEVDAGTIIDVTGFHRGESTEQTPGYGIFPSAFASAITVDPETGEVTDWNIADYIPIADPCDYPADTLPGLGSYGVTLEMGALYSPPEDDSPAAPPTEKSLLCKLALSELAGVTVTENKIRGGIVLTDPTQNSIVDPNLPSGIVINPLGAQ